MTIYVRAKSVRELNARLDAGHIVHARKYLPDGSMELVTLNDLPNGTYVRLYSKTYGSSPITQTYALWDAHKHQVKR